MGIKIQRLTETESVYDITVQGNENFFANGILVHNCAEIDLPTKPLNDINDGAPEPALIRMTKAEHKKYLKWREMNPKTPIHRN